MDKLITEFKCSKVYYIEELKLVKIIWDGSPDKEEYRKPFLFLLEYAKTHPIESSMSDIVNQGIVSIENRKWFEAEMIPASVKAGLKRTAVVINDNPFKKYYLNMLLNVVNKFNIPVKVFTNHQAAENWVREQMMAPVF